MRENTWNGSDIVDQHRSNAVHQLYVTGWFSNVTDAHVVTVFSCPPPSALIRQKQMERNANMVKRHWSQQIVMSLLCLAGFSGFVHPAWAQQFDHLIDWDVLPNGLMILEFDQGNDGVPDYFTRHPVTWSGWTTQSPDELEAQACADGLWVFIVEYDQDRYAYFSQPMPVLEGEVSPHTGEWSTHPVLTTRRQIPHPEHGDFHKDACPQAKSEKK